MIRLSDSIEGQTEENFVTKVLADVLRRRRIEPTPIRIGRARSRGQGGGNVSVQRLVTEMITLRHSHDAVTSLVDFYGFQNRQEPTVDALEARMRDEIQTRRPDMKFVIPYVQKYEFEGLLFSDVEAFRVTGQATDVEVERLSAIRQAFENPEEINDSPYTAPSKRLLGLLPGYRKRLHGPLIAGQIGPDTLRVECPRFHAWLTRLEGLASPQ